jgi:twitching motility protein PilT
VSRIDSFLELVVQQGGSDLHVVSGLMPRARIHGRLEPIRFRELTSEEIERLLDELMTAEQKERFARDRSVDFAYPVEGLARFRVSVFEHLRGIAALFRVVPSTIPSLKEAGLPEVVARTIATPRGLSLVTGPTGSGKSTTLAAMVDHINATRRAHIVTIEDPIEFVHEHKKSVVTQREIGADSPSFHDALRDAVREDPDVVLVGEMRDLETIRLALSAADTGVQVLATLPTNGAVRSIDRLVGAFPPAAQEQVRNLLAESLRMVVSQQLARKADGSGRIAVAEVLLNNQAASSLIRSGRSLQLASVIQAGGRAGMRSLDAGLEELVRKRVITGEEAYERAIEKQRFERYLAEAAAV